MQNKNNKNPMGFKFLWKRTKTNADERMRQQYLIFAER